METKQKTLPEIINNNPYSNEWATPEAYALYIAELYASEGKKDEAEPFGYVVGTDFFPRDSTVIDEVNKRIADIVLENQTNESQQPLSIAWMSEKEIYKLSRGYLNSSFIEAGIKIAQNELKRRVIDPVDEKQILISFCGWLFGGLCSETEQSIVNDYLNTK